MEIDVFAVRSDANRILQRRQTTHLVGQHTHSNVVSCDTSLLILTVAAAVCQGGRSSASGAARANARDRSFPSPSLTP
jgi:hypothetical protein